MGAPWRECVRAELQPFTHWNQPCAGRGRAGARVADQPSSTRFDPPPTSAHEVGANTSLSLVTRAYARASKAKTKGAAVLIHSKWGKQSLCKELWDLAGNGEAHMVLAHPRGILKALWKVGAP